MFRFRWLHSLFDGTPFRKDRRRQAARQRRGVRLTLETLEDRLTPSTVTESVANAAQLQTNLNNATGAYTDYIINLTGTSADYNLAAGQELTVSAGAHSSITLVGEGQSITGNGNRVFLVASGANLTLQNLTITGGTVTSTGKAQGGGIDDSGGDVTLSNVAVQGNTVTGGSAAGGGIFVAGGGSLTIRDGSVIESNLACGTPGGSAAGGGVAVTGAGNLSISDSILRDNSAQGGQGVDGTAPGVAGGAGGSAYGGGLYVAGSAWTVTLTGDTFAGNTAIGGNGGNGAMGSNATAANTAGGRGGEGGTGGDAMGGAAYFTVSANGNGYLTILDDLNAPTLDPSTMIDNSAQAGAGGIGGDGGISTGTAINSSGGRGGDGGEAAGGALYVSGATGATLNVNIANSTFFRNQAVGGNNAMDGAVGTGGSGMGVIPDSGTLFSGPIIFGAQGPGGGLAVGGGLALLNANVTMVNSTVALNNVASGFGSGPEWGGGIYDNDAATVILDNNTITQNSIGVFWMGEGYPPPDTSGAGVYVASGNPTLVNNLILDNQESGASASDLDVHNGSTLSTLSNATNNFIGSISANAVNTTTNIVGNGQPQLGSVVGVTANGIPTGGPIYYPLLPNSVSIGAGSPNVLNTIANVEGTTPAAATDEIGNLLSINGSLDLGAVQLPSPSPLPSPPSSAPSMLSLVHDAVEIAIDIDALYFRHFPPALTLLGALSEDLLGQPLPSAANLIPIIEADYLELLKAFGVG